jgi:hypothetical protein
MSPQRRASVAGFTLVRGVVGLGQRTERRARQALSEAALDALDSALRSRLVEEAADRILASGLVERVLRRALDSPEFQAIAITVVESPGVEQLVQRVADSPSAERLVGKVIDSRLTDAAVEQLLASEDLWLLVDEIARSPSVTDAISHQSVGFAEQVAGGVRVRTRSADARLEGLARRLLRREPLPDSAPTTGAD